MTEAGLIVHELTLDNNASSAAPPGICMACGIFAKVLSSAAPIYGVSQRIQPQVVKFPKKTLIFLKKGIDFIENFAIIG